MELSKIGILLIDDKPVSLIRPGTSSPSLQFGFNDKNYPEALIGSYFQLCWLQSPRDVREFRSFTEELIQQYGHAALAKDGFVPEIVLFDYRLSPGMGNFIDLESKGDLELETYKSLIPTYRLAQRLGKQTHRFPNWELLKEELAAALREVEAEFPAARFPEMSASDKSDIARSKVKRDRLEHFDEPAIFFTGKDDMGCYAGGLVTLQFKDHPCVGVPITSKNGVTDVSPDALYFEWLLSEDFDHQFGNKYGRSPYWDEIIPCAVFLLRQRITSLVRTGKVVPDYDQLQRISTLQDGEARAFSFVSAYGERHLPLDGLFIDFTEDEERAAEIKVWAEGLLKCLPRSESEIARAIQVSETLWDEYVVRFGDRIELSNLAYWSQERKLTPEEQARLERLKSEFGVVRGRIRDEVSIQKLFSGNKGGKDFTVRLAALHLVTRAAIEMNKLKKDALHKAIFREFEVYEYFNLLFPTVSLKDNLVLPMHVENETDKNKLTDGGKKWLHRKLGVAEKDWANFEVWITPGEKLLLKSFFFALDEYYPVWLK
jgi:hypothetical protein